jgi:hypothetical protein
LAAQRKRLVGGGETPHLNHVAQPHKARWHANNQLIILGCAARRGSEHRATQTKSKDKFVDRLTGLCEKSG